MTRLLTVASLACAVTLAAGCGGGDDAASGGAPAGAATSGSPTGPASAPSPAGGSEAGIGASAARSSGVFSADYDAALRGPDHATAGSVTLRLVNVGRKADSYRLTVRPAGAGTVTPATARLAPGAAAEVTLDVTANASVHVVSAGRGAEVADLPVKLG